LGIRVSAVMVIVILGYKTRQWTCRCLQDDQLQRPGDRRGGAQPLHDDTFFIDRCRESDIGSAPQAGMLTRPEVYETEAEAKVD